MGQQVEARPGAGLQVISAGDGEPVLFVHGCVTGGPQTWRAQTRLVDAGRWSVNVVQRRGFPDSPPSTADDFERDAADLVDIIDAQFESGAHVVAHSYGALGSMFAAAERPQSVKSLVLLEPPAYSVALEDADIRRAVDAFDAWWSIAPDDHVEFLRGWCQHFGVAFRVPDPLPPAMAHAVQLLRGCRRPWSAELPVRALACAEVRTLVISGGHSSVLDHLSATLAAQLGAGHLRMSGAGHAIPSLGDPLNTVLERFWSHKAIAC